MKTKICAECQNDLDVSQFEKGRNQCKFCRRVKQAERASKRERPPIPESCTNPDCDVPRNELQFEKRSDTGGWRNICNKCNWKRVGPKKNATQSEKYRTDDKFRQGRQNYNVKYRIRNPEAIRENNARNSKRRGQVPDVKMRSVMSRAKSDLINFVEEDYDVMKTKLSLNCVYCGEQPSENLNTLDRVDSRLGYSDHNTVPACEHCNYLKNCHLRDVFIKKTRDIVSHLGVPGEIIVDNKYEKTSTSKLGKHGKGSEKSKKVKMKVSEILECWFSKCHYCGVFPAYGIDRLDTNSDYALENTVPACMECNYMKRDYDIEEFKYRVAKIAAFSQDMELSDINDLPQVCAGRERMPRKVKVSSGNTVVWPAEKLNCGSLRRKVPGEQATVSEFRTQNVTKEDCLEAFFLINRAK